MWTSLNLEDLFHIGSSRRVLKSQWQDSGIPFYRGREITKLSKDGVVNNDLFISEELYSELANKSGAPKVGDIVITAIGTIGNSYIVRENDKFYFKDASVLWLKKTANVSSEFINIWLKSPLLKAQLDSGNGATVDTLTIKKLQSVSINLPPLETQKQIVAKLDQAFADIEKAKANAERNLLNARELFDSYLSGVFSNKSDEWINTFLGQVAQFKNGLNFSQNSKGEEVKIVGVRDFKSFFWVPFEQLETIRTDGDLDSSYELKKGDIITVRSNGNKRLIGRCLLVGDVKYKTSYSGFTIRIRIVSPDLDPTFLAYYLKSATVHELLISSGSGANISNLNQKILSSLPVTHPDKILQKEIVINIEKIEFESKKLVEIYQAKIQALDELKQSILQKAFNGELA
jgi:type I restriction enzyme S subunit